MKEVRGDGGLEGVCGGVGCIIWRMEFGRIIKKIFWLIGCGI